MLHPSLADCCAPGQHPPFLSSTFDNGSLTDLSGLNCDGGPHLSVQKARLPNPTPAVPSQSDDSSARYVSQAIYLFQELSMVLNQIASVL
jgi:hypothetical protein